MVESYLRYSLKLIEFYCIVAVKSIYTKLFENIFHAIYLFTGYDYSQSENLCLNMITLRNQILEHKKS